MLVSKSYRNWFPSCHLVTVFLDQVIYVWCVWVFLKWFIHFDHFLCFFNMTHRVNTIICFNRLIFENICFLESTLSCFTFVSFFITEELIDFVRVFNWDSQRYIARDFLNVICILIYNLGFKGRCFLIRIINALKLSFLILIEFNLSIKFFVWVLFQFLDHVHHFN